MCDGVRPSGPGTGPKRNGRRPEGPRPRTDGGAAAEASIAPAKQRVRSRRPVMGVAPRGGIGAHPSRRNGC